MSLNNRLGGAKVIIRAISIYVLFTDQGLDCAPG